MLSKKVHHKATAFVVYFFAPFWSFIFYKGNKGKGLYKKVCITYLQTHNNMVLLKKQVVLLA